MSSSTLDLALTALQSLAAVAFVVAVGYIYSIKGHFPLHMQRDIARLVVQLLAPCLLLVSIAQTVSADSFVTWWPIPVLFFLFSAISYLYTLLCSICLRIPRRRFRFMAAAAVMGNTNSLPVALMHSLAHDPGSRAVMGNGDAAEIARRGIAFVLFFSLFSNVLRWTFCYQLMAKVPGDPSDSEVLAHDEETLPVAIAGAHSDYANTDSARRRKSTELFPGDAVLAEVPHDDPAVHASSLRRRSSIFSLASSSEPNTAAECEPTHSATPDNQPTESTPLLPPPVPDHHVHFAASAGNRHPYWHPRLRKLHAALRACHELMNAPLYAAFAAVAIGLIPPVKSLFFGPNPDELALFEQAVTNPLYGLGEASVPVILLTLGGQLGTMGKDTEDAVQSEHHAMDVGITVLVKMVLTPLTALPIMYAIKDSVELAGDPTFTMALLLLSACPTALNLMNISQAQRNHETITATLLFWSYLLSVPILTAWVVGFLIILRAYWN
ncbi:hypothetical protein HDU85_007274 [Gaertneriomyces sp. JEL0708]|nr:hypothetical protein HDU85_007274 [Gaertneriomyces sp. JEL0708]